MSLMRTYRRALGLSQSAFAAQLNVPGSQILTGLGVPRDDTNDTYG